MWAVALIAAAAVGPAAATAAPARVPVAPAGICLTSIDFDAARPTADGLRFRARVDVACPAGVAFNAAIRSASGCELRADSGARAAYELFADVGEQSPVVSCSRPAQALTGTGRRTFLLYGRIERPAAVGHLTDTLLATITR